MCVCVYALTLVSADLVSEKELLYFDVGLGPGDTVYTDEPVCAAASRFSFKEIFT